MEPTNTNTLEQISDALIQEPITLEVTIEPQSKMHAFLQRWKIRPKKRVFIMRPIFLGSLIRISKVLLSIDFKIQDLKKEIETGKGGYLELNYHAINNYTHKLAEIVAIAIQNNEKKPSPALINFVVQNFTAKEINKVVAIVFTQMDLQNFMSSIISIRGLNVLENVKPANAPSAKQSEVSL